MRGTALSIRTAWALMAVAMPLHPGDLEEAWRHWSHVRTIELDDVADRPDLVAIAVDPGLYDHARPDLADVRVLDAAGEETGYVVLTKKGGEQRGWRATEISDAGFVPGRYSQLVADTGESNALHNQLEIRLGNGASELFTWVEVAASSDRETWRLVREKAPIYRFRNNGSNLPQTALRIRYPPTRDRWLRLRLLKTDEEVSVAGVAVCEQTQETPELTAVESGISLSPASPCDESHWTTPENGTRAPISAVSFSTTREAFHRPVAVSVSDDGKTWRQVARGLIYRHPEAAEDEDSPAATLRESIRVHFAETKADLWRVAVRDGDDPPLADLAVTLERPLTFVVFRPRAGTSYRLIYGNARAKVPEYEIARLATRDSLAEAPRGRLGPETENLAYVSPEPFTERHPALLWLALGLAVAVLAWLAVKTLR